MGTGAGAGSGAGVVGLEVGDDSVGAGFDGFGAVAFGVGDGFDGAGVVVFGVGDVGADVVAGLGAVVGAGLSCSRFKSSATTSTLACVPST